jgi:excisionase family DNA binding protein
MATAALTQETYLPDSGTQVAKVYDFLQAHDKTTRGRYFLVGAAPGDQVELPAEIYRVLRQVIDALRQGLGVTVAPVTQQLTTQQAADLLGVSRPTVIKLLDDGQIPFERIGTHRRVRLRDVLAFREQRRAAQYAALEATSVNLEDEEDLEAALQHLHEARRAIASRRRQRPMS